MKFEVMLEVETNYLDDCGNCPLLFKYVHQVAHCKKYDEDIAITSNNGFPGPKRCEACMEDK